jgi:hypothetical protein
MDIGNKSIRHRPTTIIYKLMVESHFIHPQTPPYHHHNIYYTCQKKVQQQRGFIGGDVCSFFGWQHFSALPGTQELIVTLRDRWKKNKSHGLIHQHATNGFMESHHRVRWPRDAGCHFRGRRVHPHAAVVRRWRSYENFNKNNPEGPQPMQSLQPLVF